MNKNLFLIFLLLFGCKKLTSEVNPDTATLIKYNEYQIDQKKLTLK
jgi:hypothetical protein